MKTARRQDLRTNELSEQLIELSQYARSHGPQIGGVIVVVAAVLIGGYLYRNQKHQSRMQEWQSFLDARTVAASSVEDQIAYYRRVADQSSDRLLSAWAILKAGHLARQASVDMKEPEATRQTRARQAEEAYQRIVADFADERLPAGAARVALGVLAENRRDFAAAREAYQKLLDDHRYDRTPARVEADHRLKHLEQWTAAIEFPPALPPATAPATVQLTTMPATAAPDGPQNIVITPGQGANIVTKQVPVEEILRSAGRVSTTGIATTQPVAP